MANNEDYACRLYIHSNLSRSDLGELISNVLDSNYSLGSIKSKNTFLTLKENNKDTFENIVNLEGFLNYKYTSFVEPLDEIDLSVCKVDKDVFKAELMNLITFLRSKGFLVVASAETEFEEEVVKVTGWNWTVSTPNHPILGDTVS